MRTYWRWLKASKRTIYLELIRPVDILRWKGISSLGLAIDEEKHSRLAGKATMPIVLEDLDNSAMAGLAAVENIHRKDLTDLELGLLFLSMQNEGYTQEEIADSIKKKRGYVVNRLRLAEAPADIQTFLERKPDSLRAVAYLIKVTDEGDRALLLDRLTRGTLTADDLAGDTSELVAMLKGNVVPSAQEEARDQHFVESQPIDSLSHREHTNTEASQEKNDQPSFELRSLDSEDDGAEGPDASPKQEVNDLELEVTRIGRAKLRSVLRSYQAYYTGVAQRPNISRREQQLIHEISEIHTLILSKINEQ